MMNDDMKVSKGLGFHVLALRGEGRKPAKAEDGGFEEAVGDLQQLFVHSGEAFTHSIY
jgi:hypothetical protein